VAVSRSLTLNALEGGITRLRNKGGANPRWLYDLVNGYIAQDGTAQSRPGTSDEITLPVGTRGLVAVNGALVVFSNSAKTITDSRVTCEILTHPTDPTLELVEIHFAGPFLGGVSGAYLYVVAEFADRSVFHYWLQRFTKWTASSTQQSGALVEPTVRNGFSYRAKRLTAAAIPWAANVTRAVNDKIEPIVGNGFQYTVISTLGANPRSGTTEPIWPAVDGATVVEETNAAAPAAVPTPPATPPPVNDGGTRYGNPGGSVGSVGNRNRLAQL
jgi:hypothetical protein